MNTQVATIEATEVVKSNVEIINTATKVKDLGDWRGEAALYTLSEPHHGNRFVIVSTADIPGLPGLTSAYTETYIFGADKDGENVNLSELPGSMKNCNSHAEALKEAGYALMEIN